MKETITKPLLFTGQHVSEVFKFSQIKCSKKLQQGLQKTYNATICTLLLGLMICDSWVWPSYSLEVLWEACPGWIPGKGLPVLGLLGQYLKTENFLQSLQPCASRSSLKETPHPLHDAWCSSTATWSDWAKKSSFLSSDGGMQMAFGRGRAGTETCQMKTEREWKYKDNFPPNKNFEPNISISLIQQIEVTYCSQKWICNLYAFTGSWEA